MLTLRGLLATGVVSLATSLAGAADFATLQREYSSKILPLMKAKCQTCHSTDKQEGELDLEQFVTVGDIRKGASVWLKVIEQLDTHEMPPRDAKQLSEAEFKALRHWLDEFTAAEADATAGDPGPVVLRRLNNVEYTLTIQQLTGQPLEPAREFPADSAAGEGFTNTGNSLVMSPALLSKYMNAAKEVAEHAMLLPDGIRFSPYASRRDWTDDVLRRLREFYAQYTDSTGGTKVNLQGLQWETNQGGRLPLPVYLSVLLESRDKLRAQELTTDKLADDHHLNRKYMQLLWQMLSQPQDTALLNRVQTQFWSISAQQLPEMLNEIAAWQIALTRFQSVGHMKPWLAGVEPIVESFVAQAKFQSAPASEMQTVSFATGDAGDSNHNDVVVWQEPRLVAAGRVDIALRDVGLVAQHFRMKQKQIIATTEKALAAASAYVSSGDQELPNFDQLSKSHNVSADVLAAWFDYLSVAPSGPVRLDGLYTNQQKRGGGYEFVNGWSTTDLPSIMASSGDNHVRIPGNMKPHGVVVHPSPTLNSVVGWRSPIQGSVKIEGVVTHAHPECGNGVSWTIELRRGSGRQRLASGTAAGGNPVTIPMIDNVRVRPGELLSLAIGPRDGNHACDLTDIEFKITEIVSSDTTKGKPREWNLTADVSPNILQGNPHADQFGNQDAWNFYSEPVQAGDSNRAVVPLASLLGQWLAAGDTAAKAELAKKVQQLLSGDRPLGEGADRDLWDQAHASNGPLLGPALDALAKAAKENKLQALDGGPKTALPIAFGKQVTGGATVDPLSFAVSAPNVTTVNIPAELCAGRELVATASLDKTAGADGSVQVQVATITLASAPPLSASLPLLSPASSQSRARFVAAAKEFRDLLPAALCYTKIVPVDEVVTLALFHREDENLQRLMLGDQEKKHLDDLWQELHFVSNDLLTVEDAYEQLMQFATQDSDPKLFEHLREPIKQRANDYRDALIKAEPSHVQAVIDLAGRAFRRPLTGEEEAGLRTLYKQLRDEGLNHEAATRLLIVRVLVSTSFLYRLEHSPSGDGTSRVNDWEMASRLSYFLWSCPPDEALLQTASRGQLQTAESIKAQTERMLKDSRTRNFAREFACHWLHIQDIAELDEKSERHFPEFATIRGALQTEAKLYFTDLFQNDGSLLNVFDSDYTFVNEQLAKFYGIEGVTGDQWRRVDNVKAQGRGGVLGLGATLAKQSGASRTSPILRGNWVSEVLLGEKLPKPPKNVPQLPTDESSETLTVRELVEIHSQDELCSGCHQRIDPFGFALESYDAIGRLRKLDLAGHALDTAVKLPDGTQVSDAGGLRAYLVQQKRDVLLKQFCRKLLGYALGRSVQLSDEKLLNQMMSELKSNDFRFSAALMPVVTSQQFTHIRNQNQ